METKIPIEISARHIHLSKKDSEALFGAGFKLTKVKQLTQPCDFAAKEQVEIQTEAGKISKVRIVGPVRSATQLELSITDALSLGINPPIRSSGDVEGSAGILIIGPKGKIEIKEGVIITQRHLHINPAQAEKFGLENGQIISVEVKGERAVVFQNIETRVRADYELCLHLDTDEGNAAGINKKTYGFLVN